MKLCQDLKYTGEDKKLELYGDKPWHCTSFAANFSDNESRYILQQPFFYEGVQMGYTQLDIYVLTEDELVKNFKIIQEDGSLKDIIHSKDNVELQESLKKAKEYIDNMTDEDFKKMIEGE